MKRKRKQPIFLFGRHFLAEVPEDDVLYQLDSHEEYLRRRGLLRETSLDSAPFDFEQAFCEDPQYLAERADLHRRLVKALSRLTLQQRRILKARFQDEYSQAEIARLLGCSQQKISWELKRILHILKEDLSK